MSSQSFGCFGNKSKQPRPRQPKKKTSVREFVGLKAHTTASAKKRAERIKQYADMELEECTFKPNLKHRSFGKGMVLSPRKKEKKAKKEPKADVISIEKVEGEGDRALQPLLEGRRQFSGHFLTAVSSLENFANVLQQLLIQANVEELMPDYYTKDEYCKADFSELVPASVVCGICLEESDDKNDDVNGAIIKLKSCQHQAHLSCLKQQLRARWASNRISFNYLLCGECRTPLEHDTLNVHLQPHLLLKQEVERICLQQAQADGLIENIEAEMGTSPGDTVALCMSKLSCYLCSKCYQPFCGGRVECGQDDNIDVTSLKCPSCAFTSMSSSPSMEKDSPIVWFGKCHKHGYKFAVYKCDSCCAVATWDCRTNHYCTRCHNQASSVKNYACPGRSSCPLGIDHPPNREGVHGTVDEGFVIGCSKCFLGRENEAMEFELATDSSSRGAIGYWKDRF